MEVGPFVSECELPRQFLRLKSADKRPMRRRFVVNPLSELASLSHALRPLKRGLSPMFPKTQAAERNVPPGPRKVPWPIPIRDSIWPGDLRVVGHGSQTGPG